VWGDRTKIALEEKNILKLQIAGLQLFCSLYQTRYCPNLRAIEHMPFELELFKVFVSSEKTNLRKQR